jgi:hypothetical protein
MNWKGTAHLEQVDLVPMYRFGNASSPSRSLSRAEICAVRDEAARQLEEARQKADEVATLCAQASQVGRRRPVPQMVIAQKDSTANREAPRY